MYRLLDALRKIIRYAEMLEAKEIARRMFVTNSFDGLLTALGVILGNFIAGVSSPRVYFAAVGGASLAMGVFSGIISTYFSERAERLRELHETERAMLKTLSGSIYEEAARLVPLYVAFWSGIGATILPLIGALPFLLHPVIGFATPLPALVYASVALILGEMFILGFYLGKVASENPIINGLRLLAIGVAAAIVLSLIKIVVS